MIWSGVMPAMTTAFDNDLAVDHRFLAQHAAWLLGNGCTGLVMLGSLGEGATLEHEEKIEILRTAVRVAAARRRWSRRSLRFRLRMRCGSQRKRSRRVAHGLMVLPPYVLLDRLARDEAARLGDYSATQLSCMLYNNPIAYKTDFLPDADRGTCRRSMRILHAVKESSADVRRVRRHSRGARRSSEIFVGVDDAIVEGVDAGATGWIAGLVNAYPAESVELFNLARAGRREEAFELYRWFLPLLRMDTVPKFVQLIKWVQEQAGVGSARVRSPRMELAGAELADARAIFKTATATRPKVKEKAFSSFQGI